MVQAAVDLEHLPPESGSNSMEIQKKGLVRVFVERNKIGTGAFIVLFAILLLSFVGPFFMPGKNPTVVADIYAPPSLKHPLGGDYMGKDVWYQIVHGGSTLILVSLAAALMSTAIAVVFGSLSAMIGGKFDAVVLMIADVVLTVPYIILLGVLAAYIQLNSPFLLSFVLAITAWPTLLRAVRSQVLSLKEREYVEAARMLDLGLPRILFREVIPNMMSYIIINFVLAMTSAIYGQVILFFLGLVPLAGDNWGLMINQAYTKGAIFFKDSIIYILAPIFMISVLQLSLVLISQSLEDVFNPRLREE
ncbi:MAG TPA: ABC transporter permease [Thermomicrobiales bacterium]|nr:ABC transporter permease [Thermomicrobiales bacterium]